MSTANGRNTPEFTDENIQKFVRAHDDPCVTASEVASHFGVTNGAANYRLKQLGAAGEVEDKHVGASAKVWYVTG